MNLDFLNKADLTISQKLRLASHRVGLRRAAALFAHSADSWFWLAGLAVLYFVGPPLWKPLAAKLILGILITAAFVLTLKRTIKRPRPRGEWGKIYRSTDPHSFPSGHAARTAFLTLLSFLWAPLWLAGLMALWTLLVDCARIALGVHYLSDILAGTAIGLLFGWGLFLVAG